MTNQIDPVKFSNKHPIKSENYYSFRFRLVSIMVILMILPIISLVMYTRTTVTNTIEMNQNYLFQLNQQTLANLTSIFDSIDRATRAHMYDPEMNNILSRHHIERDGVWLQNYTRVERYLRSVVSMNPYVFSIVYINQYDQDFSSLDLQPSYVDSIRRQISQVDWEENSIFISLPTGKPIYQLEQYFISYIKPIQSSYTFQNIGYICIDIAYRPFVQYFTDSIDQRQASNFLILSDDTVIYDSAMALGRRPSIVAHLSQNGTALQRETLMALFTDEPITRIGDERYLVEWSRHEQTSWSVIHYTSYDELVALANDASKITIIILGAFLILVLLTAFMLTRRLARPINQLQYAMAELTKGRFEKVPEPIAKDEIGFIIRSYNNMLDQLNANVVSQYQLQLRQTQTELKMLQYQINPHFLYNTLNLISSIAELEDNDDIYRISNNLSALFRYNLNARSQVKLKEEIEQTHRYLDIQKMRFPGKFNSITLVEPEVESSTVPRFLLQPLVENAMYHGLERRVTDGVIIIAAHIVGELLDIRIVDNGGGIEPVKLDQINASLKDDEKNSQGANDHFGIGILNVNNRIRAYYGQNYGLSLYSIPGEGTEVKILLPRNSSTGEKEDSSS